MGGRSGPEHNGGANVVTLCGDGVRGCHGWVESNRDVARLQGWLVPSWAGVSPSNWPVQLRQGWHQPRDGYWEPADPHPLQVEGSQRSD